LSLKKKEKLSNKEHREKAWKIYHDNPTRGLNNSEKRNSLQQIKDDNIDKEAVESIERKLKLLNKVQSGYRQGHMDSEIETVKEVLRPNANKNHHLNRKSAGGNLAKCKNMLSSSFKSKK
jgi:hypothetical protein